MCICAQQWSCWIIWHFGCNGLRTPWHPVTFLQMYSPALSFQLLHNSPTLVTSWVLFYIHPRGKASLSLDHSALCFLVVSHVVSILPCADSHVHILFCSFKGLGHLCYHVLRVTLDWPKLSLPTNADKTVCTRALAFC